MIPTIPLVSRAKRSLRRWSRGRVLVPDTVNRVIAAKLTYLDVDALCELHDLARSAHRLGGGIIEAGCALGGSAIVIAAGKRADVPLSVYDVFATIPPPGVHDGEDVQQRYATIVAGEAVGIRGEPYYGYEDNLIRKVTDNFSRLGYPIERNGIALRQGLFQDSLYPDGPVALAHIDGDWYESVAVCLQRICPRLVVGGTLVIDDYDAWSGCRRAVDDFFVDREREFRFERHARLHVVRHAVAAVAD